MSKVLKILLAVSIVCLGMFEQSCVCVPDINTPKEVVPVVFSGISFINSISDVNAIDIKTKYNDSVDNINSLDEASKYIKVGAGDNSIRVLKNTDKSVIFNSAFFVPQEMKFTYIFYGRNTTVNCLILSDSILNYSDEFSYLRFVNLSKRCDRISFRLIKDYTDKIDLDFPNYSEFMKVKPAQYKLEIRDRLADTLFTALDNLKFDGNKRTTLIFRDVIQANNEIRQELQIIKVLE